MGKVEKIVVLSVLFLIVLILAISLNTTTEVPSGRPDPRDEALVLLEQDGARSADPRQALERLDPGPRQDMAGPRQPMEGPRAGEREVAPGGPATAERPATTGELRQPLELEPGPRDGAAFVDPRRRGDAGERGAPADRAPGLLSSGVREASAPREDAGEESGRQALEPDDLAAPPIVRGADWDLLTTERMRPTVVDTLLVYTCRAGDTFEGLARRFYGDASRARLLRLNNEDLDALVAGQEILVPVHDDTGDLHVVARNESLWAIAQAHYGNGARWREIFEANRHLLDDPGDLRPGMELILP